MFGFCSPERRLQGGEDFRAGRRGARVTRRNYTMRFFRLRSAVSGSVFHWASRVDVAARSVASTRRSQAQGTSTWRLKFSHAGME